MSHITKEDFDAFTARIENSYQHLTEQNTSILSKVNELDERITGLENVSQFSEESSRSPKNKDGGHVIDLTLPKRQDRQFNAQYVRPVSDGAFSPIVDATEDIQGSFQSICDAVQRIKLPAELCLKQSKQGVSRENQTTYNLITRSAKYTETSVKLLSTLKEGEVSEVDLQNLFTVQLAHTRYLQDELASIIVQSQFDPTTTKLFRSLQRNSSVFTPEALENLRRAAAISAAKPNLQQQRGRGRVSNTYQQSR